MCIAIEFAGSTIWLRDEQPYLPLLRKDGEVAWIRWGLPMAERWSAKLPGGGVVRREAIDAKKWKRYQPRPVKILANRFLLNVGNKVRWVDVADGMVIQGAMIASKNTIDIATRGDTILRVYIVTEPTLVTQSELGDRIPRLVPRESRP